MCSAVLPKEPKQDFPRIGNPKTSGPPVLPCSELSASPSRRARTSTAASRTCPPTTHSFLRCHVRTSSTLHPRCPPRLPTTHAYPKSTNRSLAEGRKRCETLDAASSSRSNPTPPPLAPARSRALRLRTGVPSGFGDDVLDELFDE
ncbi:hypothetical protein M422DRAFT_33189 [Sphaerobolus stellatus SS14]|uniref:Uncharacterized protein n=1 Tax=Sphaerobolus stellatus (strain SS14) TaxID=990650 RepID=A0A0C9VL95_SPHS4|nr:hypothetical protein M422DRAFT_33189 [Sphaerobolus stellatus SS14]